MSKKVEEGMLRGGVYRWVLLFSFTSFFSSAMSCHHLLRQQQPSSDLDPHPDGDQDSDGDAPWFEEGLESIDPFDDESGRNGRSDIDSVTDSDGGNSDLF